ncbi:hypothetical protein BN8_00059 [Fibrisoma limi BUZ 3]|uniref:Uncharacterized protein n=1 Tax=Fibrisoma limi BUZ 3 TaxID=1185876 RepID=I2GB75_9BACT|nr:hypothetical protein [Fibrisoma limi]CCH51149.1 hypothetical protein BN8_00059 [Fibrisoma limi BUZ 3]
MKLYDLNLYAIGLVLGAWLLTRLGYALLPSSDSGPFYVGFLIYLLAYPVMGWSAIRAVWWAIRGHKTWVKSLLLVAATIVQFHLTLAGFLLLMAEAFRDFPKR